MNRRDFLKGSATALAVAAAPLGGLAHAVARPGASVLLVHAAGDLDDAFAAGARSTARALGIELSVVQLDAQLDPGRIAALLRNHAGARLIGLMDDSSFAVFREMARDAGAALLASGHHAWREGTSRHAFTTGPRSSGIGTAVAAADRGCSVSEICLATPAFGGPANQPLTGASWTHALGDALARVALDAWQPVAAGPAVATAAFGAPSRNAASFVMQA